MAFKDLLHRRVPQFVGAYLVAGWGIVQFIQLLETRYTLSTVWVEMFGLGWLLLLPAIVGLAWNHGAPGRDPWTRGQVLSLGANLITAAIILVVAFSYRDVDAATTTISVEDENGETVVRQVPTDQSSTRSLLVFFLEDRTGGAEGPHWLTQAIPYLIHSDLLQDLFVDARSPYQNRDLAERLGADPFEIPRSVRREIADRHHVDFYLDGILKSSDPVEIEVSLVNTESARVVARASFSGTPFSVADETSRWSRELLDLPEVHLERNVDQPVADMLTSSIDSLRLYLDGYNALYVGGDYVTAMAAIEKSVEADPTNALAQFQLFSLARLTRADARERADRAMKMFLKHVPRLPDRLQFLIKHFFYSNIEEPEKSHAVLELWAKLMPRDPYVHTLLADVFRQRSQLDDAVAAMKRALELFPGDVSNHRVLAEIYEEEGRWDEARAIYSSVIEMFPDDPSSYLRLGDLKRVIGELDDAAKNYEKALLLDPANAEAQIGEALIDAKRGRFDQALEALAELAEHASAASDRSRALENRRDLLEQLGRLDEAMQAHRVRRTLGPRGNQFGPYILDSARGYRIWAKSGRYREGLDAIDAMAKELPPQIRGLLQVGRAEAALFAGDPETARDATERFSRFLHRIGSRAYLPSADALEAGRLLQENRATEALRVMQQSIDTGALVPYRLQVLGEVQRANGELDNALATFERALKMNPASPEAHFQAAKTLNAMGQRSEALKHIDQSLQAWTRADASFQRAKEAKELRVELLGS